jgi:hypothetical protein
MVRRYRREDARATAAVQEEHIRQPRLPYSMTKEYKKAQPHTFSRWIPLHQFPALLQEDVGGT